MKKKYLSIIGCCAAVIGSAAVHAADKRSEVLVKLPDWQGVWRVTGSGDYLSGDKNNQPPFKDGWVEQSADEGEQDSADRYCAIAMPRLIGSSQSFEIIVTPDETLVYYASREIRHIWTDGRDHPPEEERWPMFWAESKGTWQGQTLMVNTIEVHGDLWIDQTGAKLSDQAQISERISQVDDNHLQNQVTITDPLVLQEPWSFTRTYQRLPDQELREQGCEWTAGQAANQ